MSGGAAATRRAASPERVRASLTCWPSSMVTEFLVQGPVSGSFILFGGARSAALHAWKNFSGSALRATWQVGRVEVAHTMCVIPGLLYHGLDVPIQGALFAVELLVHTQLVQCTKLTECTEQLVHVVLVMTGSG